MKRTAPRWCPERQQRRPGHPARRRLSRSRGTFRKTPCSARRAHLPENTPLPARSQTCFEGPFGELLRATGPMAKANPFRFSTKYQDDETDLIYYGCRYFGPSAGRWISRDPIEELGEQNLYDFCANNPTHYVDRDGRAIWRDPTDVNAPHTVSWPALQNESTFPYGAVAHGSMWLIGALGNTNVISGLDPMAEEAKKMPEVDYVRRMWQVRLRAHGCHPGMSPINVLRHAGVLGDGAAGQRAGDQPSVSTEPWRSPRSPGSAAGVPAAGVPAQPRKYRDGSYFRRPRVGVHARSGGSPGRGRGGRDGRGPAGGDGAWKRSRRRWSFGGARSGSGCGPGRTGRTCCGRGCVRARSTRGP